MTIIKRALTRLSSSKRPAQPGNVARTISDMESDGVYFPDHARERMSRDREKLVCHYSGLPSVIAYMDAEETTN